MLEFCIYSLLDMARQDQAPIISPRASPRYSVTWDSYYDFNAVSISIALFFSHFGVI